MKYRSSRVQRPNGASAVIALVTVFFFSAVEYGSSLAMMRSERRARRKSTLSELFGEGVLLANHCRFLFGRGEDRGEGVVGGYVMERLAVNLQG